MQRTTPVLAGLVSAMIIFPMVELITGWNFVPILRLGAIVPMSSSLLSDSVLAAIRGGLIAVVGVVILWMIGFTSYKMAKSRQ